MQHATAIDLRQQYINRRNTSDLVLVNSLNRSQLELFEFDKNNFHIVEQYLKGVSSKTGSYFLGRYKNIHKSKGFTNAYEWLGTNFINDIVDRVDRVFKHYDHLPEKIIAGKQYLKRELTDDKAKPRTLLINKSFAYFSVKDIKKCAYAISTSQQAMYHDFYYNKIEDATALSLEDIDALFRAIYKKLAHETSLKGITAPYFADYKKGLLTAEKCTIGINKMICIDWWQKKLTRLHAYLREHLAIAEGKVAKNKSPYTSTECFNNWKTQKKSNLEFMEQMELVNEEDEYEVVSLKDMFWSSVGNPVIRRHELMARARGFEEVAKEIGYVGEFYTLTAPSKFHAVHSSGSFIDSWNGCNPKQTQEYLCNLWAKVRAKLKRDELNVFGFRVVEPHHDGTPHWHLLLFMDKRHVQKVRNIISRYALAVDGKEPGAAKHRFTYKAIDPNKGSATGYIAKYIAKNIDGYALDDEKDDETGENLKDMAKKVSAWASHWRIRQFQQIGGAPVSVWRELRRRAGQPVAEDAEISDLIQAADESDWGRYVMLQGGPCVKRKELVIRADYKIRNTNKYGEAGKTIIGITKQANNFKLMTRFKHWIIRKAAGLESKLNSARSAPWSSVNNCTVQFSNKLLDFIDRLLISRGIVHFSTFEKKALLNGEAVQIHPLKPKSDFIKFQFNDLVIFSE